jgi:flagellar biosynthesis chaperone FliJ
MEDNWKKLQAQKIDTKLQNTFERKLKHLKSVITDPDKYNINLASKDSVESLEQSVDESQQQIEELQKVIEKLNHRVDGLSYLIKQKFKL